ncbi:MAG: anti-sigma factor [Ramlibacter sp.]
MRYADPRLVDHLAAAYVLGTLAPRTRARFERLRRDRGDVDLAVTNWESRLGLLAQSIAPVKPSPRVWRAIEARTRQLAVPHAKPGGGGWLKLTGAGLAGIVAGVAVSVALFMLAPALIVSTDQIAMRSGEKLPQSYVGLLTDAQGDGKLLVSSLRRGKVMTMKVIGPIAPPATGHLVLWAVPADGSAFALGPVPLAGSTTSQLPDSSEKLLAKVRKLVVTLETTEAPTAPGPVVFSGNCAKLW